MNRSGSILTRGRASSFFSNGFTPITSGFILRVTEETIPPTPTPDIGGRSGRRYETTDFQSKRKQEALKRITISVYINNEVYSKSMIVDENVSIKAKDVHVELHESGTPIITVKMSNKD